MLGDTKTLLPDPIATVEACRQLVDDGFQVLCYTSDDPITARRLKVDEASAMGLVNRVAEEGKLMEAARELADAIAKNGPVAVRAAKRAVDQGSELALGEGLEFEAGCYEDVIPTQDRLEALAAFAEKRKPVYRGA